LGSREKTNLIGILFLRRGFYKVIHHGLQRIANSCEKI
jgi:hypothetical protein